MFQLSRLIHKKEAFMICILKTTSVVCLSDIQSFHKVLNEQCIVNFLELRLNSSLVILVLLDILPRTY